MFVMQRISTMDAYTTPNALHRLAKLHTALESSVRGPAYEAAVEDYVKPILTELRPKVLQQASQFDAWGAAMALWSYGSLRHNDQAVVSVLIDSLLTMRGSFKPVDCANIMSAFANLGHMHMGLAKVAMQVRNVPALQNAACAR